MSLLDTVAFVDLGDSRNNFVIWLQKHADLTPVGITAEELWEFRNGLLHMTNLHSRAVLAGKIARLIFFVGNITPPSPPSGEKYFNLRDLIDAVAKALSTWFESYNNDRNKLAFFVSRYDLTISDSRMAFFSIENGP